MEVRDGNADLLSRVASEFSSLEDFEMVEAPSPYDYSSYLACQYPIPKTLPKEEIASRNIALLACYPLQEWKFFAIKGSTRELPEVVPKRERVACTSCKTVLTMVEASFALMQKDKNRRFAFLKERVIEKIRRYGEELSQVGKRDAAQEFLVFARNWEDACSQKISEKEV